jgi:hypothetical protein
MGVRSPRGKHGRKTQNQRNTNQKSSHFESKLKKFNENWRNIRKNEEILLKIKNKSKKLRKDSRKLKTFKGEVSKLIN